MEVLASFAVIVLVEDASVTARQEEEDCRLVKTASPDFPFQDFMAAWNSIKMNIEVRLRKEEKREFWDFNLWDAQDTVNFSHSIFEGTQTLKVVNIGMLIQNDIWKRCS